MRDERIHLDPARDQGQAWTLTIELIEFYKPIRLRVIYRDQK